MLWQIVGMLAAGLTMFGFVPQLVKSLKTRSVKDVSFATLVQFAIGVTLWTVYGVFKKDLIIIIANVVTLITLCTLIYLHFTYGKEGS